MDQKSKVLSLGPSLGAPISSSEDTKVVVLLLTNKHQAISLHPDSYKILTNLIDSQPLIFKLWMGIKLVILTTQPTHAEVILKTCFNRLGTTKHMEELFQTGLFTSPGQYSIVCDTNFENCCLLQS
jgi:hypothetical protein